MSLFHDEDRSCPDENNCPDCRAHISRMAALKQVFATKPPARPDRIHDLPTNPPFAAVKRCSCSGRCYWTGHEWFCPKPGCPGPAEVTA